jgi:hypothetical protein
MVSNVVEDCAKVMVWNGDAGIGVADAARGFCDIEWGRSKTL